MAVGDDAAAAGYPVLTGDEEVLDGYIEVNRTRDEVAGVLGLIQAVWSTSHGGTGATTIDVAKVNLGISFGTDDPSDSVGGNIDGNIYFKVSG